MAIRLGIDASQSYASCAVSTDLGITASAAIERPIENFPALIRDVMARAGLCFEDLDEIVVCIGPGSQTGIRTAVVTGNALALALNKPVSGVLSTDAAAMIAKSKEISKVAVSAGRRRWYVQGYQWNEQKLCRLDELQLMDEIPEDAFSVFSLDLNGFKELESCACGILLAADQQRQLIEQSLLNKILPYEGK